MSEIISGLLTIWFLCLGLAIIVRQHKRFIRWSWKQAQRPFLWAWKRWRMQIVAFFAGVGFGKLLNFEVFALPLIIALGIVLGGWLIGLALARFWTNNLQGYVDGSRQIIKDATQYLWKNFRTQIIWFSIGMVASIFIAR